MNWLLETRNITKSFSGVRVLADVSFELGRGEIHAVMGENGAGKSTLMKLLAGIHQPDGGEILLEGSRVQLSNAHLALRHGVAMVYQEPMPFLDLTVAENIFMGQEPVRRFPGWIDHKRIRAESMEILERLGLRLDPGRRMRELRVAEMQTVEIAKALAHNARIIIFDEPTSALSEHETEALFRILGDLKSRGVSMVYISHKLEEVFRLADRVTVLRDGRLVARHHIRDVDRSTLISEMVGRTFTEAAPACSNSPGSTALRVSGLCRRGRFRHVSFDVRCGEVLGLAGLMGAGRTEVVNAIYGLDPPDSGEIHVHGRKVRIRHPQHALKAGIGLVSGDRKLFGFVPAFGARANMTLAALRKYCRAGWIMRRTERRVAQEQIRVFRVRGADRDQPVARLSGGNQQKVVLARMLLTGPDILLLDEPTRGIDIAAKAEVHELIRRLVREGKAVVLVSSELPELLALSDRILVMREGEPVAELNPRATTPAEVLKLAMPQ